MIRNAVAWLSGRELAPSAPVLAAARSSCRKNASLTLLFWQSREADLETLVPLSLLEFRACRLWELCSDATERVGGLFLYSSEKVLMQRIAALCAAPDSMLFAGMEPDALLTAADIEHLSAASALSRLRSGKESIPVTITEAPPAGLLVSDRPAAPPRKRQSAATATGSFSSTLHPGLVELDMRRCETADDVRAFIRTRFAARSDSLSLPRTMTPP